MKKSHFINTPIAHWIDTALVTINAILVCLFNMEIFEHGSEIHAFIGQAIIFFLCIFVVGELIRLYILKLDFFKDHRNIFCAAVLIVAIALRKPDLTILLLFNSFRALRLLTSKKTRHIIDALFHAIPGALNLLILIIMAFFIFAVLGTNLFGEHVPKLWGTITQSLLSLQQIMVGDNWGSNLEETMKFYPYAWIFSTAFLILVTFILLNVFIGVIVDAMQAAAEENDAVVDDDIHALKNEISSLRKDINLIKAAVTSQKKS